MECIAIIPARGGSKGIPRKNALPLAGKPLVAHNIEQAQLAELVNRVAVSTDDAEIAAISRQYGAEVIWRPDEISGDSASSEEALLHALEYLSDTEDYHPDLLAFLQCTSPLTRAEDIDGTIQALLSEKADTSLAVIPFHYFIWRSNGNGNAIGINHNKRSRPLRQEREPQYLETGAVYVMKVPEFLQIKHRFFGKTALYNMPSERRLEIDELVDLEVAEVLLREYHRQQKLERLPKTIEALALDFDGVFTDNKVYVFQDGREAVKCDRGDGWGIGQLKRVGLPILVISSEPNPVVRARADKLGIPSLQGLSDKVDAFHNWIGERGINPANVVYVGNDLNDIPCMTQVGCAVAVADAHPQVQAQALLVLDRPGGDGAIREICELILWRMGIDPASAV